MRRREWHLDLPEEVVPTVSVHDDGHTLEVYAFNHSFGVIRDGLKRPDSTYWDEIGLLIGRYLHQKYKERNR